MFKLLRIGVPCLLVAVFALFTFYSIVFPGGRVVKRYDKDHNIIGYSVIENGRETRYSKAWSVEGYSIHSDDRVDRFDDDWNRDGYGLYEGDSVDEKEY